MRRYLRAVAAALALGAAFSGMALAAGEFETDAVRLGGLDKVTARVTQIDVPVGGTARFGALEIRVLRCLKRPPEEPPESAAFMVIRDSGPDDKAAEIFEGWMFASSPSLSALEHPVYDVWVIECRSSASSSADSATGNTAALDSATPKSR